MSRQAYQLTEPLTAREQKVLRFLPGRLSLREIGQQLDVSRNTIKSHTRAVYQKLGVSSRHDAIQRGRELGLLLCNAPSLPVM
jgi:LuxR family transcriptional regulator, maltose regulon positive regulatory protein